MHTYIHSTYVYFFEVTSIRTYLYFLRSYFKYFLHTYLSFEVAYLSFEVTSNTYYTYIHTYIRIYLRKCIRTYVYFFEVISIHTYLSFLRSYFKYFLRNSFGVTSLLLTYLLDFDLGYRKYQLHCFRYILRLSCMLLYHIRHYICVLFQHLVLHLFIHYFATSRLFTYLISGIEYTR